MTVIRYTFLSMALKFIILQVVTNAFFTNMFANQLSISKSRMVANFRNGLLRMVSTDGMLISAKDVSSLSSSNGRTYKQVGMPRLLPPSSVNDNWLMWFHARDENFDESVVSLSTGRILLASSNDGLTNWELHEDSPVLNPNKENGGDWYFFDSEHVGLGDVIQPGDSALSKIIVQVFKSYSRCI